MNDNNNKVSTNSNLYCIYQDLHCVWDYDHASNLINEGSLQERRKIEDWKSQRVLCNSKSLIGAWLVMPSLLLKPTVNITPSSHWGTSPTKNNRRGWRVNLEDKVGKFCLRFLRFWLGIGLFLLNITIVTRPEVLTMTYVTSIFTLFDKILTILI